MAKLTPDNERFWFIHLWLHIHNLIDEYIQFEVDYCEIEEIPMKISYVTEILHQVFPNQKFWFTSRELFQVWQYDHANLETYENGEEYLILIPNKKCKLGKEVL